MTLLSYVVTSEQTVAFVITRKSLNTFRLPVGEQELTALVQAARQPAERHQVPPAALDTLYQKLIAPLASHLKTPLLGIVPHGVLHYLPFAALTDAERYLHDSYTLFFLPGASALAFFRERAHSAEETILAIANSEAQGLPNLPCADQEVQALATFYPRYYRTFSLFGSKNPPLETRLRQDNAPFTSATETALKTLAPDYSILHLAAHGELNVANPLFSRILLVPDDHNDGVLEVHEIYELELDRTELVVLSACDTQLGQLSRGDDLIGLTRAFMYAGAPSVIASLWKVNDQVTRDFMVAFYFFLKHSPTKADALRAAQRLIRKKYPHPYYWAAFVLTGDPGIY
jgi:CHAT domain-containing protein